jgi:hypothetical protein
MFARGCWVNLASVERLDDANPRTENLRLSRRDDLFLQIDTDA